MNKVSTNQKSLKIKNNLEKIEVKKFYFSGGYFVHKIVKLLPTALLPTTTVIFFVHLPQVGFSEKKTKGTDFLPWSPFPLVKNTGMEIIFLKNVSKIPNIFFKEVGPQKY